jgi:hypothetical protein
MEIPMVIKDLLGNVLDHATIVAQAEGEDIWPD